MLNLDPMLPKIPENDTLLVLTQKGKEDTELDTLEGLRNDFRKEVHKTARRLLKVGSACLGAIILVRIWHLIGPLRCRWLEEVDIASIDKMLFSSAFGGAALNYVKEMMLPRGKEESKDQES